ncbi:MAG: hypothetical protein L0241_01435 [Planctomycetia bacterium]|nr:hypothetical protein [Planctomycetia bacterium]
MAFEDETPLERAYPYWHGWCGIGCAVVLFGLLGGIGVALLPLGYEKLRGNQMPLGIAMMVMGVFAIPVLAMAFLSLFAGIRNTIRPPILRVTATALHLPADLRHDPREEEQDERGEPKNLNPPPIHPEEIPFSAIRRICRDTERLHHVLEIFHDLAASPLRIEQAMMHSSDFEELETVLRSAIPTAFASAPPQTQTEE